MQVASRWLYGAYPLAINTLWGGFVVALGGFALPFKVRRSMFEVQSSVFTISISNLTPLPRLPRGGLGAPWTNPGHGLVP
jgi:hypothetical protein